MASVAENIRRQLILKKIKLWESPFVDSNGIVSGELEKIAQVIAAEQNIDFSFVWKTVEALQKHSLEKVELDLMYNDALLVDDHISTQQLWKRAAPDGFKFDSGAIDWGLKKIDFTVIEKSCPHWSAPRSAYIEAKDPFCPDYKASKCDPDKCQNAKKFSECVKCGPDCRNQRFKNSAFMDPALFKIKSLKEKGLGLFTSVGIEPGTWVIEYVGQLMSKSEFDRTEDLLDPAPSESYGFQVFKDVVINARHYGNLSRFINHSCGANLFADVWTVGADLRVVFTASRKIDAGEELTLDYGEGFKAVIQLTCKCEYEHCRRQVGGEYGPNDKAYVCDAPGCNMMYKYSTSLRNHRSKEHKKLERRTCRKCAAPKIFRRRFGLLKHDKKFHLSEGGSSSSIPPRRRKTLADKEGLAPQATDNPSTVVKRGRGRPRKQPLPTAHPSTSQYSTRKYAAVNRPPKLTLREMVSKRMASNQDPPPHPPPIIRERACKTARPVSVAATEAKLARYTRFAAGPQAQIVLKRVDEIENSEGKEDDDDESYEEGDDVVNEKKRRINNKRKRPDSKNVPANKKNKKATKETSSDEAGDGEEEEEEDDDDQTLIVEVEDGEEVGATSEKEEDDQSSAEDDGQAEKQPAATEDENKTSAEVDGQEEEQPAATEGEDSAEEVDDKKEEDCADTMNEDDGDKQDAAATTEQDEVDPLAPETIKIELCEIIATNAEQSVTELVPDATQNQSGEISGPSTDQTETASLNASAVKPLQEVASSSGTSDIATIIKQNANEPLLALLSRAGTSGEQPQSEFLKKLVTDLVQQAVMQLIAPNNPAPEVGQGSSSAQSTQQAISRPADHEVILIDLTSETSQDSHLFEQDSHLSEQVGSITISVKPEPNDDGDMSEVPPVPEVEETVM